MAWLLLTGSGSASSADGSVIVEEGGWCSRLQQLQIRGAPRERFESALPELKGSKSSGEERQSKWPGETEATGGIPEGHCLCGCWNMGLRVPEVEPGKGVECQTQTHSQKEQYPGCRPRARKARQGARDFDLQQ